MRNYKSENPEIIFSKVFSKKCEACNRKDNLFISLVNGKVACNSHGNSSQLYLRKDTFFIYCFSCNSMIPVEKSLIKTEFEAFKKKIPNIRVLGCTGLVNLGNTCYMNSIIQVLSNLRCIKKYFFQYITQKKTSNILNEFKLLLSALWQGEKCFSPKNFIQSIDLEFSNRLNRTRHQDTLEFFHLFHNIIDQQLNNQLGNSTFFKDIFTWKIENAIECIKCKNKSISYEELLELPLCIPAKDEIFGLRNEAEDFFTKKDKDDIVHVTSTSWKKIRL